MQAEADRINIHNKLNAPERQPMETVFQYMQRIKEAAVTKGFTEDDYIIWWQ